MPKIPPMVLALLVTLAGTSVAQAIVWRGDVEAIETVAKNEMMQVGKLVYSPLRIFGGTCVALNDRWVLTSRHGTEKWSSRWLRVSFPASDKTQYRVKRVILCPDADIALLELENSFPDAKSISLYSGDEEVGKRAWIGGFGKSGPVGKVEQTGIFYSGHNRVQGLRGGKLSVTLSEPGEKDAEADEATLARMDSGSPLFIQVNGEWQLAGIASTASNSSNPGYGDRGNYARLSKVVDWIEKTMP